MAKNEIKLRTHLLNENALQRHRNYALLLQQHKRERRKKKTRRIFFFSIIVAVVTVLLLTLVSYFMVKWEKEREQKKNDKVVPMR